MDKTNPINTHTAQRTRSAALTRTEKYALLVRVRGLDTSARAFATQIFTRAKKARGCLDDDVYGVLFATLEALEHTGGIPPPLAFGISHCQTGIVEHISFVPSGLKTLPKGGKLITNHPALTRRSRTAPGIAKNATGKTHPKNSA